ncbi:MAG TPA: serine hydrolase [Bacteroidia bacterium]|nr:serine hydrolase [Bacteroidia bacterium]
MNTRIKRGILIICLLLSKSLFAQNLYFPPLTGNNWDTLSPSALNWCQPRIDSLYQFLEDRHTKSFIILKDGKIILEKYFGTYTADSIHYWASAGKSLTAFLTGIAQEKGFVNIQSPVSQYLGTGWTSAPPAKESLITLRHLLTMTSGLDDSPPPPCDVNDSSKTCLNYLADAGTRWAYHSGAYKHLQDVISVTSGMSYNAFTTNYLSSKIGMGGLWYDAVFYSKTRGMARFGLLTLSKGIWNNDTILKDTSYIAAMSNTSQNLNNSYGYLWWLNGKASFMIPQLQVVFPGAMLPAAPPDLFAALGKNDQKIYVVPSENLVVVRMGDSAYSSQYAVTVFDNELWTYIDSLSFCPTALNEINTNQHTWIYPNPANNFLQLDSETSTYFIYNIQGRCCLQGKPDTQRKIDISMLQEGVYYLKIQTKNNQQWYFKFIRKE